MSLHLPLVHRIDVNHWGLAAKFDGRNYRLEFVRIEIEVEVELLARLGTLLVFGILLLIWIKASRIFTRAGLCDSFITRSAGFNAR